MFSTYALQGLETKVKGEYSREELAPLAQTNVESLHEFGFFTFAKADGKKQKFEEPVDYYLEYKDSLLTLHFTLPFKAPVAAKNIDLEVYDPTYFVDFSLAEKDPVALVNAPKQCKLATKAPGSDAPSGNAPVNEQFFNSLDQGTNYGAQFANKISVKCP